MQVIFGNTNLTLFEFTEIMRQKDDKYSTELEAPRESLQLTHPVKIQTVRYINVTSNWISEIQQRVSMGLTDRRKTAKNLVDSRKN